MRIEELWELWELELDVRSFNCLKRAGIQTVGDLISKPAAQLNAIPNFGEKSLRVVIEALQARGLQLAEAPSRETLVAEALARSEEVARELGLELRWSP